MASVGVDCQLKPNDIAREGIRGLSMEQVQSAMMGRRYGLVCHAERQPDGTMAGSVCLEEVQVADYRSSCYPPETIHRS